MSPDDGELSLIRPESNVPPNDQRTHVVLTDERFIEYLSRIPAGVQKDFSSVMLYIKGCMDEIVRLKEMEQMTPDARGNVRVQKDTTSYFIRRLKPGVKRPEKPKRTFWQWLNGVKPEAPPLTEDQYEIEERRVGIYTVLPAKQIPLYRRKFERETSQALDWVWRMLRGWIAEDGKSRAELIDALQASNGRLMPPEAGKTPGIVVMNGAPHPGGWVKNR